MQFSHDSAIWNAFLGLVAGVLLVNGVGTFSDTGAVGPQHAAAARDRLSAGQQAAGAPGTEGAWPEIQAWRRVYTQMGFAPTQVRCAAEALLRRLRQQVDLPQVHPLVDFCNAVSVHAAAPVAVFDCAQVVWPLTVRYATGRECYKALSGETETPAPGEVVFADDADHAHARKWAHR